MRLIDILKPQNIKVPLEATAKNAAIAELVNLLGTNAEVMDPKKVLDAVLERREDLPNFQDISTDQLELTTDDNWKTYFFFGYGFKSEANCARCPRTTELLERIPGMKTAMFSVLSPGKHISAHRGPYKGVLRYHLGLKIPEPRAGCRLRVGEEVRHWEEGGSLLFDDTFEHEAWNDTDGVRVVLAHAVA